MSRAKIAEFILKIDPPKNEKTELILSALSEVWLSPYAQERKQEEGRVLYLLSGLSEANEPASVLTKLLSIMRMKLILSVRLLDGALAVIDKWIPALTQKSIDELVLFRFELTSMLEIQKNSEE